MADKLGADWRDDITQEGVPEGYKRIRGYQSYRPDPPRPNTADQACDDLIEFLDIRNSEPAAAKAYEDLLESGLPIFTCEIDRAATEIAGKSRAVYKLQEVLMRHVTAFRAMQRVDANR